MLTDLRATPHLDGPRVVVDWTWWDDGERPDLQLVRRRDTYPHTPDDGRDVLDLGALVDPGGRPWARVTRLRCLLSNSVADGGLLEAEVVLWFGSGDDPAPSRGRVAWYSPGSNELRAEQIDGLVEVHHTDDGDTETLVLLDGGGSPTEVGRVELATTPTEGRLWWRPSEGRTRDIAFHRAEIEHTTAVVSATTPGGLRARWRTGVVRTAAPLDEALTGAKAPAGNNDHDHVRTNVTLDEQRDADSGDWRRRLSVTDHAARAHEGAYYRVFVWESGGHRSDRAWRVWARPTARYGFEGRLYGMLPAFHQRLDEADGDGRGQLRRFLSVFGLGLDHLRGSADDLHRRHDVLGANPEQLAHLSRWIGWEPDRTAEVSRQRSDVRFAPAVYDTVGTVGNLRAIIKRAVGWESETKEFAHNVVLTNAPEPVHTWELWSASMDTDGLAEPEATTDATAFDGRPAAVVDGDGERWLFWESERGGRRTIWLRGPDHPDAPALDTDDALEGAFEEHPAAAVDGAGNVWLYWTSVDPAGRRRIRRRRWPAQTPDVVDDVTTHPAVNAYPAVTADGDGGVWVFWQSARRGPTDIWYRHLPADGTKGEERRLTTADGRHEMPAAVTDAEGRIWLFWVADAAGGRLLWTRDRDRAGWSAPEPLYSDLWRTAGPWRDEAPCAVLWQQQLWLLWHSNRDGQWNLWASRHVGRQWSDPMRLTDHVEADKEPTAVVDGNALRVWWRSQRQGACRRSRTLDTTDDTALAAMGTLGDRVKYVYDTGTAPDDWYARDTVGVALKPTGNVGDPQATIERIADYVEPFQPLPVRLVWLPIPIPDEDVIDTDDLIEVEYDDAIDGSGE